MGKANYQITTEIIHAGAFSVKINRIINTDDLFNELIAKGELDEDVLDERIPYWGELWHSSIALSEFLAENKHLIKGKNVLEIGCGLGLCGITAYKAGANVIMTDYSEEAIEFAKENLRLNHAEHIKMQVMDWRNPDPMLQADVLIAADVAYEKRSFGPLLHAFNVLLKQNGLLILSEPGRSFTTEFFKLLEKNRFRKKTVQKTIEYREICINIDIHLFQRHTAPFK